MSTYRYRTLGANQEALRRLTEAGLVVVDTAPIGFIDIFLSDDGFKPDLDEIMATFGYTFYVTNPTGPPQLTVRTPSGVYWGVTVNEIGTVGVISPTGVTGAVRPSIYFGDGDDGDLTINTGYLPKNVIQANNLTIGTGDVRIPSGVNGASISVRGVLSISSGGRLHADYLGATGALGGAGGVSGQDGATAPGVLASTVLMTHLSPTGELCIGATGGRGGVATNPAERGGTGGVLFGTSPGTFQGGRGGAGGGGGATINTGAGAGARGGLQQGTRPQYHLQRDAAVRTNPVALPTYASHTSGIIPGSGGAGGGGGGCGAGVSGGGGGTGGAGGAGGGWLHIAAYNVQNNGVISANGATGFPGGNGIAAWRDTGTATGSGGGGGGAGGGGGGGAAGIVTVKHSIGYLGSIEVIGGFGGFAGRVAASDPDLGSDHGATGGFGQNGEQGATGLIRIIKV